MDSVTIKQETEIYTKEPQRKYTKFQTKMKWTTTVNMVNPLNIGYWWKECPHKVDSVKINESYKSDDEKLLSYTFIQSRISKCSGIDK